MPFFSLETRWFVDGALDPEGEVVRWFRTSTPFPPARPAPLDWPDAWREDTYLVLPQRPDIGVKVRVEDPGSGLPGRIEFKGRTTDHGPAHFGGVTGHVDRWVKWSCAPHETPEALLPLPVPTVGGLWQQVRKKRLLRMIHLRPTGSHREEPDPARRIERGVGFELTRIEVTAKGRSGESGAPATRSAWTLGFEAFPADVDLNEEFAPVVEACVRGFPSPELLVPAASGAYPAWLAGHD